ncbi:MAG: M4 family metallopeptidase [Prolixibacteraceae bacterium]|nr:M4 family metallopeptidase [Prolixibacteraceae bacterium]
MKKIFLLTIFTYSVLFLIGQDNKVVIQKNDNGLVEYVRFTPSYQSSISEHANIQETVSEFFRKFLYPNSFTTFIIQPQKQRDKDFIHEHYNQYYKGIKVDGAGYNFHFKKGKLYLAHGNYIQIEELNIEAQLTSNEAKQYFTRFKGIPEKEVSDFKTELIIKEISNSNYSRSVRLVYQVSITSGHFNNNEIGYIDAISGEILLTEPNMTDYFATGTFETRYYGTKQARTQYYNSTYNLCDSSRGAVIHTWNLDGSTDIENDAEELEDSNNIWTAQEYHSNEDDMGLDIHWALQEIYDYFYNEWDEISSFDDNDHDIEAFFHYGEQDNAKWLMADDVLVFGDGNTFFTPVACIDAVAHEYGHGITDFQIGWAYSGDLQIFHEGLSDIWGIILEYRISPNSIWKIGEQVVINYDCLRNIQDPDNPYAYVELADTYLNSTYNSGDQYTKAGVFLRWFYLLVNGGSGTNDNDNDYTVYGIGMDAAEELVVKAVFNNYLDNQSTYPGIRAQFVDAAEDEVFAENSFQALQVANAWYAVGVGSDPGQVTLSGNNYICNSGTVITANNSTAGSTISWTCSNNLEVYSGGSTSTPTFKPKYTSSEGDGWVQVNYTSNGVTTAGPKMNVGVNQPYSGDVYLDLYTSGGSPASYMCPDTYYHIYLVNDGGCSLSDYSWSIPAGWDSMYQYNNMISVYTNSYPGGMVEVYANTSCGVNRKILIDYLGSGYCGGYYSLSFTPNPTSLETTVLIEPTSEDIKFDINEEWELEIYSETQVLKEKKVKLKGNEVRIQTQGWKDGVYFVRVKYKDEIITGKLVVK